MFARSSAPVVACPICSKQVRSADINAHLDAGCLAHAVEDGSGEDEHAIRTGVHTNSTNGTSGAKRPTPPPPSPSLVSSSQQKRSAATFFQTPATKRQQGVTVTANGSFSATQGVKRTTPTSSQTQIQTHTESNGSSSTLPVTTQDQGGGSKKRSYEEGPGHGSPAQASVTVVATAAPETTNLSTAPASALAPAPGLPLAKRSRTQRAAPLAERMRPQSLDDVCGQDLVGPHGVLRALIEADRVPSMILWGGSGTGKTTIARCIAQRVGSRFVEMNATSSGGVAECKKIFQDAANELSLTGRKTILFCDEIHRFTKAQQDVFLKPVEAGTITLIGATTENPSFRVVNALLSRCRTFTLASLTKEDVQQILVRAVREETGVTLGKSAATAGQDNGEAVDTSSQTKAALSPLIDAEMLAYLAAFSDGDARTALNLLELAMSIAARPREASDPTLSLPAPLTKEDLKAALTKTLVYDRAGDQHYDTISAFHKSVRGSDADATLYYLARMLQSGEDPLFVARRMVVIASEDVGLADSTLLPLATAAYTAAQQIGMPEARIPLAHCAVALALAPKSTRAYRGLNNAFAALREPGVASLPIPVHLRNAPTRLMKELGYGKEYKYNPNYLDGRVRQDYLPEDLLGRSFLEARDLGTAVDPDLDDK
ncbi:DNA-dependent ATPase mgs1 [Sporothrix epigloea]|uniref:DNA-dependent ATPase mgs1 n=1 Tax=Sporothrix epigloea TaxID=1892477 RepID=A0ABP0D9P5_9PEZI